METIEYKNYTINITQDEYPVNPREDFDHLGKMVCWHKRYNLGDSHTIDDFPNMQETSIWLPIYIYDHSGITIRTTPFSCLWDSGQVGIIFIDYETIRKEYNVKRITKKIIEKVKQCLIAEVKEYDQYLTGDVWHYEIVSSSGKALDACGGFYGYDYCLADAKSIVDYYSEQKDSVSISVNV